LGVLCTKKVFGEGFMKAPCLVVGEAPGANEDLSGRPFVGRSGQLLRKLMKEAGFRKGDVFITNVLRCRPPKNRAPTGEEAGHCFMHLYAQLDIINPKVIVAVGSVALNNLYNMKPKKALGSCRGDVLNSFGYKLVPVWHPSYVQRTHQILREKELLKDLKKVIKIVYPDGREGDVPEEDFDETDG
jgi:DNA polymerase